MKIPFHKYQGAGNDFILVDQREQQWLAATDQKVIERLCDRRFGIGADGLMFLRKHPEYDFEMVYFNSDGLEGSMCGNGGRCITAFAKNLGAIGDAACFLAVDGPHEAMVTGPGWVDLKMQDVAEVEEGTDYFYLDTGSPHYILFVDDLDVVDVVREGRAVRYSDRFREKGTNVNFVHIQEDGLAIATYERGVEGETLACGTGVTAAALAAFLAKAKTGGKADIPVRAKGGNLEVRFRKKEQGFTDIWLCGPARKVFEGTVDIADIQDKAKI